MLVCYCLLSRCASRGQEVRTKPRQDILYEERYSSWQKNLLTLPKTRRHVCDKRDIDDEDIAKHHARI